MKRIILDNAVARLEISILGGMAYMGIVALVLSY